MAGCRAVMGHLILLFLETWQVQALRGRNERATSMADAGVRAAPRMAHGDVRQSPLAARTVVICVARPGLLGMSLRGRKTRPRE